MSDADKEWENLLKLPKKEALEGHEFVAVDIEEYYSIVSHCKDLRQALDEYRGIAGREANRKENGTRWSVADLVLSKRPQDYEVKE